MIIGKVFSNEVDFNHRYSSWIGFLLALVQIGMFIYFIKEIMTSMGKAKIRKVKSFMTNLGIFGTIYFLSFPLTLIIASFIVPAQQNSFVEFMRISSEFVAIYFLAFITTNDKGNYKSVAFQSMDFVLPT